MQNIYNLYVLLKFSESISNDNKLIVSGNNDYTIKIWDLKNSICLNILKEHKNWVYSLSISNDHKLEF